MSNIEIWLYYYSLPSIMAGILTLVYHIDKIYKINLTNNNKGYNILKDGIYNKPNKRSRLIFGLGYEF